MKSWEIMKLGWFKLGYSGYAVDDAIYCQVYYWTHETFWEAKGQLNSEWICEFILSPKMPTKNLKDFCHGSLLEGRAEILQIFGWHFGRDDDLKFILNLTDL